MAAGRFRGAQTPDSKKEEFRKYLEKSGVIDAFTKGGSGSREAPFPARPHAMLCACGGRAVLVGLYEQPTRPANAVECVRQSRAPPIRSRAVSSRAARAPHSYIKRYMGAPSGVDVEALKAENDRLRQRVQDLEKQLAEARRD